MAFVVLYDANVLYPSTLRDVLVHVSLCGLVQAKWTEEILEETFTNLRENRPDLVPARIERTQEPVADGGARLLGHRLRVAHQGGRAS
jgi:hypothetical protein